MIELSPYHQIELAPAWEALRDNPPDHDQVIRRQVASPAFFEGALVAQARALVVEVLVVCDDHRRLRSERNGRLLSRRRPDLGALHVGERGWKRMAAT